MCVSVITPSQSQADLARRTMGCLADDTGLYTRLTARENIDYFARLHGFKTRKFCTLLR